MVDIAEPQVAHPDADVNGDVLYRHVALSLVVPDSDMVAGDVVHVWEDDVVLVKVGAVMSYVTARVSEPMLPAAS